MNQRIKISGMTCGNCKSSVLEKLSFFKEINVTNIDLSSGITDLEVTQKISLNLINEQLFPKYKAEMVIENKSFDSGTESSESKLRLLFPLFLIFGYLIAGTFYLQKELLTIEGFMYDFMGLFFIVFSFFKFLDYNGFPASFAQYDPLAKKKSSVCQSLSFFRNSSWCPFFNALEIRHRLVGYVDCIVDHYYWRFTFFIKQK